MKPIIYTGLSYYKTNLKGHIDGYPLWIAAYTYDRREEFKDFADIHQFSEEIAVNGIKGGVDGNDIFKDGFRDLVIAK